MFFNKKETNVPAPRRDRSAPSLSPRFARLVRESWWLVVVAAFVWLALILATYAKTDPGWSFSGVGAPIANRGGLAGAWLADLLLYLFGISAWWWVVAGVVLVVAGYRRIGHPELETDHPLSLGVLGFGLVLLSSAALEALRLYNLPVTLPQAAGGALGEIIGRGLSKLLGFNGATLLLLALFAAGSSLFFGLSWLKLMERIGTWLERAVLWLRRRAEERKDRALGAQALAVREAVVQAKHEVVLREPVLVVPQVVEVPKSDRVVKEKQRPLFIDLPDSPLPPLALLDDAPGGAGNGERRHARIHVATDRAETRRFRRRREGAGGLSRAGDHPLRGRAGGRRQGRADRESGEGPRARAVGGLDPRRRNDSGQVVHGARAAQPEAADREAHRDPVVGDVQRQREPADAGAGEGHRRQGGDRRPRPDAAPARRRNDRVGQVGRGQRDDPVPAVQGRAAGRCA